VEHQDALSNFGLGFGSATRFGAFGFSGAISKDGTKGGAAADILYQYVGRRFSVGIDQQMLTPWYATISQPASADRQISSTYVNVSRTLSRSTSLLATYTAQHWRDQSPSATFTAGIMRRIGRLGSLSLSVGRQTTQGQHGSVVDLSFYTGVGAESTLSIVRDSETGQGSSTIVGLSRTPRDLNGLEYQLEAGNSNGSTQLSGIGTYRARYGLAELQTTQGGGSRLDQFTYAGSIAMSGGAIGIGQPIDGAFAVIDTGVAGVPVTVNGRIVGRTDKSGKIVAFGLVPYLPNQISIDTNSLPEDVIVDTPSVMIVPMLNSGRTVKFPIHKFQAFTGKVSVLTSSGPQIPSYGQFVLHGVKDFASDVGEDGAFFLENVPAGTYKGEIAYKGGDCTFTVTIPSTRETFTKLGVLQCAPK
jgi:outer membrane usher protein